MKKKSKSHIHNKSLTLNHFFSTTTQKQNRSSHKSSWNVSQSKENGISRLSNGSDDLPEFRMTLASLAKTSCAFETNVDASKKLRKHSGHNQLKKRKLHTLDSDVQKSSIQTFFESTSHTQRKIESNVKKKTERNKIDIPMDSSSTCNIKFSLKKNNENVYDIENEIDSGEEDQNIQKLMQNFDNEIESFTDAEKTKDFISTEKVPTQVGEARTSRKRQDQKKSNNILFALQERRIMDGKSNRRVRLLRSLPLPRNENIMYSATSPPPKHINAIFHQLALSNKIKVCPTVQFSRNQNSNNQNQNRMRGKITSLEIDSNGILIATASSSGDVIVYDFDELNALDLKCRNVACRENVVATMATATYENSSIHFNDETSKKISTLNRGRIFSCNQNSNTDLTNSVKPMVVEDDYSNVRKYKQKVLNPVIELNLNKYVSCVKWNPDNEDQLAVSFM